LIARPVPGTPVDAGALHDHQLHLVALQPGDAGAQVPLEATKLAAVLLGAAVCLLDQNRPDVLEAT